MKDAVANKYLTGKRNPDSISILYPFYTFSRYFWWESNS